MRILLISDPSSYHTNEWVNALSVRGFEVCVFYVDEWIHNRNTVPEHDGRELKLVKEPPKWKLVGHSIAHLAPNSLIRDLRHHTWLHQNLDVLGSSLHRFVHTEGYEFIHAHGMATSALLADAARDVPFSASAWGSDIYIMPEKYSYIRPLMAGAIRHAAFIQAESHISARRLEEIEASSSEKLFVSTWGVDTNSFKPGQRTDTVNRILGCSECEYILSFRALEPLYRIDAIIRAFVAAQGKLPDDLKLVIGSDGSEKPQLQQLIHELHQDEKVVLTGYVDSETKRSLLASASLYVQYPTSDGVSISMLEAMSSGLPLVASDVGETRVLLTDRVNGILVNPNSVSALEEAIVELMNHDDMRTSMAANSREIAVRDHDRNVFFDQFAARVSASLKTRPNVASV